MRTGGLYRCPATLLERNQPEAVDLEVVVRLAAAFGVSAPSARMRLEICEQITKSQANVLDAAIHAGEHNRLHRRLGLEDTFDRLAHAQRDLPRLPAVMQEYGFRALEQGFVEVERLADALGKAPDWVEGRMTELAIVVPEDEPDSDGRHYSLDSRRARRRAVLPLR